MKLRPMLCKIMQIVTRRATRVEPKQDRLPGNTYGDPAPGRKEHHTQRTEIVFLTFSQ